MPREQTRALVEGAFFASLTAIFSLISIYVPLFSFLVGLVGPMPTAVLVKRYNLKIAMLSLLAAVFITVFFYGNPLAALLFTFQIGVLGLLLGLLLKKNISGGISIVLSALGAVILTFFSFLITFIATGINPLDIAGDVKQAVNEMYKIYQQNGAVANLDQEEIRDLQDQVLTTVTIFLPGSLVIWSLILGGLNYLLARELFKRLKYKVVILRPFRYWQFPWYSTWGVILGIGLLLIGDSFNMPWLSVVAKNILYVFAFVFAVLGLSVVMFYVEKFSLSKIVKFVILFTATIYWPITIFLLLVIGILDAYINFRRLVSIKVP